MKKFLVTLHAWLGFPLGLLFIVTFGTGGLTAIDDLIERFEQKKKSSAYVFRPTTLTEDANALTIITKNNKNLRKIILPTPDTPYYQAITRDDLWTYSIDDLNQVIHTEKKKDGFFDTVLSLHRNYLLGSKGLWGINGKYYVAWVGLIALFISLLGLWLWWPLRKTFKTKNVVPLGTKRKHFYYSHMTSGVIVLIVIVLFSVTGASISYRAIAQQLLGVERDKPSAIEPLELASGWQPWLQAAYAKMPNDSRLEQIRLPKQKKPNDANKNNTPPMLIKLRFSTPGDWLDLASSSVEIDKKSSTLVNMTLFSQQPLGEKIYSILAPLHIGTRLPIFYVITILILTCLGTVMVFSGLSSFITKKRQWLKIKKPIQKIEATA